MEALLMLAMIFLALWMLHKAEKIRAYGKVLKAMSPADKLDLEERSFLLERKRAGSRMDWATEHCDRRRREKRLPRRPGVNADLIQPYTPD